MKIILFIAFICTAALLETEAAIAQGSGNTDSVCPSVCGRCDNRDVGESWEGHDPSHCVRVTCTKDRNSVGIEGVGCADFVIPPGSNCTTSPGNPNARYPMCCPHPVCPSEDSE